MLRGEGFPRATNAEDPTLVVLSASAARLLFGQEDPVGRELPAPPGETGARVVGVVPDLQVRSLRAPAGPAFYEVADQRYSGRMMLLVRGTNVEGLARPLRELIAALDPDLGIGAISTLHERMLRSLGDTRVVAQLAGLVASVAIFLAAIGLYGIVSFATVSRTAEIGLRMALGARAGSVRALVLRRGMTLTIAGLLIGLGFTLAVGGVLASLLYGISPRDPGALIASTVGLAVIALIAAWVPARRATRVDPVRALRHD
jgi:hypothetical protein